MRQVFELVKQMGPGWVAHRAAYSLKRQTGWLERRFPANEWSAYRLSDLAPGFSPERLKETLADEISQRFFISSGKRHAESLKDILPQSARDEIIREAEGAGLGTFSFFSHRSIHAGWPPEWHLHPESRAQWPKTHWTKLPDLGEQDVKWLWEIGRFGFAYSLVRAYHLTGDAAHAETFWQLVASFRNENPPNLGVHWMCGQECAFRVLALSFALFGLIDATTSERAAMLIEMLAAHGERIEGNIEFAILQKNNHAINEALALWTLGAMFPFLCSAEQWEARGREILEREAARQIYDDGSYIQHSLNYHRLILQSYSWALRLGDLAGRPFSAVLRERFDRATNLLYQLTDEGSGRAPNYGSNDGALLFKLDSCDFSDYRPALALAFCVSERKRVYPQGAWDETLWWLCGEEAFEEKADPPARADLAAEMGGYYTLRSSDTWGMIRCCKYRDRPAQADMLSVDLWWRGANILADPGAYSYNSPAPWNNGLSGTGAHNTVQIDGLDQMERGPRFTWFHWNRGRVIRRRADERIKLFEGEHDGYHRARGILHRRALMLVEDKLWIIIDDIRGEGEHLLASQWLFPKSEIESQSGQSVKLRCPVGIFIARFFAFSADKKSTELEIALGDEESTRGWFSDRYFHKEKSLAIIASDHCPLPARRVTMISLSEDVVVEFASQTSLQVSLGANKFSGEWSAGDEGKSLILSLRLEAVGERV
jgi:asparagine synthase (glutamine-hydrolysing)